jgi:hypothetical protein
MREDEISIADLQGLAAPANMKHCSNGCGLVNRIDALDPPLTLDRSISFP